MDIQKFYYSFFKNASKENLTLPQDAETESETGAADLLNRAFLISLCGSNHPDFTRARKILNREPPDTEMADLALFFKNSIPLMENELKDRIASDSEFRNRFRTVEASLTSHTPQKETVHTKADMFWPVFFPEGTGIFSNKTERLRELRKKRTVHITAPNPQPISSPGNEIIFTSNILLTVPDPSTDLASCKFPAGLLKKIKAAMTEEQVYFYDHPIQIGTAPENNEILYGLRGLDEMCQWEKSSGNMKADRMLTCILSVSVTHRGLQHIAREYIHHEISRHGSFPNLEIYVFTEEDTRTIISMLTSESNTGREEAALLNKVFGVDGEYGRHYSFLKAVAAFWQVFIDSSKQATFKIDLDQVFPERELKEQTGKSAFEHLKTQLWGARGTDADGKPVELGMIAGALVNERDIHKGIFTPDVRFNADEDISTEEHVFYSKLLMGFSTEAELMTRYGRDGIDGTNTCIQRIHVTGGTNGIRLEHLRRYRPFTPSFIGRAEDQCYILSVLSGKGTKLAYLHEDGLIMRHDKEAFASAAIKAASFGSIIGDYIRILYFSKYAEILTDGSLDEIKGIIDPFTGCFVSKIPITIVCLRFSLKALDLFKEGTSERGRKFLMQGVTRIRKGFDFIQGTRSSLEKEYRLERKGWDLFYNLLDTLEKASADMDPEIPELVKKTRQVVEACRV